MLPLIGAALSGLVVVAGVKTVHSRQRAPKYLVDYLVQNVTPATADLWPNQGLPAVDRQTEPHTIALRPINPPADARPLAVADTIVPITSPSPNHQLLLSGIALGTTCAGVLFFHPLSLLATPLIVYLEWPIYRAAWHDLVQKRGVKVDGLMALFTTSAWLMRAYVSSAFSIFIWALADKITTQSRNRSQQKLINLFDQQPRTVWRLLDGQEVETPFELVQVDDIVVVHAGQTIPVDGIIHAGMALIDQQRLTGEARPVEKAQGDQVFAATLVVSGRLFVRVEKAGQSTLAAQIAEMLTQTTTYQLTLEARGLTLAEKAVLPSLLISALAWPLRGLRSAVAVLSVMPGVDMYFAGPLALLNSLYVAAQQGILIKDGRSLERLHRIDTVVFDKTGTLTNETLVLAQIHLCGALDETEVLRCAAAAEQHQQHPIAQAILAAAQTQNLNWPDSAETRYEVGYGVQLRLPWATLRRPSAPACDEAATALVRVGSQRYLQQEGIAIPPPLQPIQSHCATLGHSLVYVAVAEEVVGVLELQPTLRPEAQGVINALQKQGLALYILSGDQLEPTRYLAEQVGIPNYAANVLPTAKAAFITDLQAQGRNVCFVGDGINDAIALQQAQVSISLAGATTIATDTAQIVLMEQSLRQLPLLFTLAHRLERNVLTNFGLSVGTGVLIIGGALLTPMGVGAAVSYGSVALLGIVGNAMTPLLFNQQRSKATQF